MSRFILYAIQGEKNSDKALQNLEWGPDQLTRDKQVQYRNPFQLKGPVPKWLNGIPILADIHTHRIYKGTNCLKVLQETYPVGPPPSLPGMEDEPPMPPKDKDNNQEFKIPPDPRERAGAIGKQEFSVEATREIEIESPTKTINLNSIDPISIPLEQNPLPTPQSSPILQKSPAPPKTLVIEAPDTIST